MSDLKQLAQRIFRETLAAIDIPDMMCQKLARSGSRILLRHFDSSLFGNRADRKASELDLANFTCIRAVAMGKASVAMARGLVSFLAPDIPVEGILVAPRFIGQGVTGPSDLPAVVHGFRTIRAGHPVPDEGSIVAAREILHLLRECDTRTLIFFLISGGGSALVELPLDPAISLADVQELNRILVHCGAPIGDINAVRKHLSAVKGGLLAAAASAATKLTLAVSDVPASRESALASGPTLPDPTTISDACRVIKRYGLLAKLPAPIRAKFEQPGQMPETPKAGDPVFARSHFICLLGMSDLFHHAHKAAEAHGCISWCDDATDEWAIPEAADYLLAELSSLASANPGRPVCLIADGELNSPVTGNGQGGRNSAFVLDCVGKIAGIKIAGRKITVLSAGTDGQDGSSPAAGAVADSDSLARARARGLDPDEFFRRSDSYNFFRALDDAIETGPTGNNLRDLRLLIAQ